LMGKDGLEPLFIIRNRDANVRERIEISLTVR
jgi:hypothetical protein